MRPLSDYEYDRPVCRQDGADTGKYEAFSVKRPHFLFIRHAKLRYSFLVDERLSYVKKQTNNGFFKDFSSYSNIIIIMRPIL